MHSISKQDGNSPRGELSKTAKPSENALNTNIDVDLPEENTLAISPIDKAVGDTPPRSPCKRQRVASGENPYDRAIDWFGLGTHFENYPTMQELITQQRTEDITKQAQRQNAVQPDLINDLRSRKAAASPSKANQRQVAINAKATKKKADFDHPSQLPVSWRYELDNTLAQMRAQNQELISSTIKTQELAEKRIQDLMHASVVTETKITEVNQVNRDLQEAVKQLMAENQKLRAGEQCYTQLSTARLTELVNTRIEHISADYLKVARAQSQRTEEMASSAQKKASAAQKSANSAQNAANKTQTFAEVVTKAEKKRRAQREARKAASTARKELAKQDFVVLAASSNSDDSMADDAATTRPDLVAIGDSIKEAYGLSMKDFSLSTTRQNNVKVRFTEKKPEQADQWVSKLGYEALSCDPWHFGVLSGIPASVTPENLKQSIKTEQGVELCALPIALDARADGTKTYKIACSNAAGYSALRFVFVNYERFALMPYKPLTKKQRAAREQARQARELQSSSTTN